MDASIDKHTAEQRVTLAVGYFKKGYGCAQSVIAAFADIYGLREEQALRIGAGFGGGVGKMRMMCGAVSGMVVLAGMEKGGFDASDTAGKGQCYKLVQDLVEAFKQENGSIICAELLGLSRPEKGATETPAGVSDTLHGGTAYTPSERTAEYYRVRPCAAKVESAARIFARHLQSKQG